MRLYFLFFSLLVTSFSWALESRCLISDKYIASNVVVNFNLMGETIHAKLTNIGTVNLKVTGTALLVDEEAHPFVVRFKNMDDSYKLNNIESNKTFISSSFYSSRIYLPHELPIKTVEPKAYIEFSEVIHHILQGYPKVKNRLSDKNIEWQFKLIFEEEKTDSANLVYSCYSSWMPINY